MCCYIQTPQFKFSTVYHYYSLFVLIWSFVNYLKEGCDSFELTQEFANSMNSFFFQFHILYPTRITDHSSTLIDNIFFNSITGHTISGNILCDLSDKLSNFLISDNLSQFQKKHKIFKRDYSKFNQTSFTDESKTISWDVCFANDKSNLL